MCSSRINWPSYSIFQTLLTKGGCCLLLHFVLPLLPLKLNHISWGMIWERLPHEAWVFFPFLVESIHLPITDGLPLQLWTCTHLQVTSKTCRLWQYPNILCFHLIHPTEGDRTGGGQNLNSGALSNVTIFVPRL